MAEPPSRAGRRGPILVWLARIGVSTVMLLLIFQFVPFGHVWAAARQISPILWLAALALFLGGHAAAAAKWRLLIGRELGWRQAFRAHLAGLAANLALPGVAGGDVVRAGLVYSAIENKGRLAMGSLADRLLDTLGLLIIALAGAAIAWGGRSDNAFYLEGLLAASLFLAALAFVAAPAIARALDAKRHQGRVARIVASLAQAAAELARSPLNLILCLGISMAVQCLFIGINIAFAEAAHVEAPASAWVFAWSTAKIIAIAPISLGGLGVREASMAGLLVPFGADPGRVVAIGLVWQSVLYASGLIGFLVQMRRRSPSTLVTDKP